MYHIIIKTSEIYGCMSLIQTVCIHHMRGGGGGSETLMFKLVTINGGEILQCFKQNKAGKNISWKLELDFQINIDNFT